MASSIDDIVSGYQEPSEHEKKWYYLGLSGTPRLIARTSTEPWTKPSEEWRRKKVLSTIGQHNIVEKWCVDVRSQLIDALEQVVGFPWETFFALRIGYNDYTFHQASSDNHPVVLFIVLRNELPWPVIMKTALHCRRILQSFQINGVEVEVLLGQRSLHASAASLDLSAKLDYRFSHEIVPRLGPDWQCADINSTIMPLLSYPGGQIEQEPAQNNGESAANSGSIGLYFTLQPPAAHAKDVADDTQSPVYAMTNRHVAIAGRLGSEKDVREQDLHCKHNRDNADSLAKVHADGSSIHMLSGGGQCALDCRGNVNSVRSALRSSLRSTEIKHCNLPDHSFFESLYRLQKDALTYLDGLKDLLDEMGDDNDGKLSISRRAFGTVAYSPRHQVCPRGFFVDWALVRLDNPDTASNKVYVAGTLISRLTDLATNLQGGIRTINFQEPPVDEDGFLQIHTKNIPKHASFEDSHRTSHVVAKRGAKTGLTLGVTNELEAILRNPFTSAGPVVSYSLLVLGIDGKEFSDKGDSGSCVFDTSGRAVGILDAGLEAPIVTHFFRKYHASDHDAALPDVSNAPAQEPVPPGFSALNLQSLFKKPTDSPVEIKRYSDISFVAPIQGVLAQVADFSERQPRVLER